MKCPFCGCARIVKNGFGRLGHRRYKCLDRKCRRSFMGKKDRQRKADRKVSHAIKRAFLRDRYEHWHEMPRIVC